jgi:DNA-binding transcriptional ArsR family regulator
VDPSAAAELSASYRGRMERDLAAPAALIAEPARAAMLSALLSGHALAAGELAQVARVSRPTASEHLRRLLDGDLVRVVSQGRHRYYRLAGPHVAAALEALAHLGPPAPVATLRQANTANALAFARTCYDHLAGTCGVALLDALLANEWLCDHDGGYGVTTAGERELVALGIDVAAARSARRAFARPCLDWTVRRHHLAGGLGAAITTRLLELDWFTHRSRDGRALRVTDTGRERMLALGCVLG